MDFVITMFLGFVDSLNYKYGTTPETENGSFSQAQH
jgi:hypothetical protein